MIPIPKLPPFKRLCVTIGAIPVTYVESLSYYETLLWLCKYLQNTVIPAVNTNAEAVTELQEAMVSLQEYVDNYFDNLDIQEELDAKLDEMAEDGSLQNILNNYASIEKVYNTLDEVIADTSIVENQKIKTLGYHSVNDGGAGHYYVTVAEQSDTYSIQANNDLYINLVLTDCLNVKQMGAYGDGVHDDTDVIDLALNLQQTLTLNYTEYVGGWESHIFPKMYNVYFPRGQYIYNGNGLEIEDYGHCILIGESKMTTSIYIQSDIYLLNSHNHVNYLEIRNLSFANGKGVYNQHSNIEDPEEVTKNISDKFVIENCSFYDYSKTAISSNFMDSPYWYINNNYFKGSDETIAIAMPGDSAGSVISNNEFILDKYHIKLQDGGRGVVIENNDFIRQTSANNLTDILILPCYHNGVVAGSSSPGLKCVITRNKFGAEYIKDGDYKIIIANQYSYVDTDYNEETRVDLTNVKNGEINDLKITKDNIFLNNSTYHPAVIYCAVAKIKACDFEIFTNFADYVVQFVDTIVNNFNTYDYVQTMLTVYMANTLRVEINNSSGNLINATNIPQYFNIIDPYKVLNDSVQITTAKSSFYDLLCSQNWAQPTASSANVTLSTYENIFGLVRGTKAIFTGNASAKFGVATITKPRPYWIEFDIKGEGNIDKVRVNLLNTVNGDKPILYKIIPVTSDFKHIQLQVNGFNTPVNQMRIENVNQTGTIYIENVVIYSCDTPLNLNGGEQLMELKLYNNENHNAKISINSSDELVVKFADGTTKKISLTS